MFAGTILRVMLSSSCLLLCDTKRGSTCGRDENGMTPLHVAMSGASSGVIDALTRTRADRLAATMGDVNHRSPLHLAVKYLAYVVHQIEKDEIESREVA